MTYAFVGVKQLNPVSVHGNYFVLAHTDTELNYTIEEFKGHLILPFLKMETGSANHWICRRLSR